MLSNNTKYVVNTVQSIAEKEGISIEKAFDKFLWFCGTSLDIDAKVYSCFHEDTYNFLKKSFNIQILQNEIGDWLGEAYEFLGLTDNEKLITNSECLHKIFNIHSCNKCFPKVIYCKRIQTGRMLLNLFQNHGQNLLLYGVESNLTLYRIALINIKLYKIPAILLCVDDALIDTRDFTTSSPNWEFANRWTSTGSKWIK